jgi:hypothetical protein
MRLLDFRRERMVVALRALDLQPEQRAACGLGHLLGIVLARVQELKGAARGIGRRAREDLGRVPGAGPRYTNVAVTMHWLIAALVVVQLILGWWMIDIPKQPVGDRAFWFNLHKSIGITIA